VRFSPSVLHRHTIPGLYFGKFRRSLQLAIQRFHKSIAERFDVRLWGVQRVRDSEGMVCFPLEQNKPKEVEGLLLLLNSLFPSPFIGVFWL
jgi:hypothetical protein